jgi:hypothetical protein
MHTEKDKHFFQAKTKRMTKKNSGFYVVVKPGLEVGQRRKKKWVVQKFK